MNFGLVMALFGVVIAASAGIGSANGGCIAGKAGNRSIIRKVFPELFGKVLVLQALSRYTRYLWILSCCIIIS